MTFKEAKKRLDNMSEKDLDYYGVLLSKLHTLMYDINKDIADGLELALLAMQIYCTEK